MSQQTVLTTNEQKLNAAYSIEAFR